MAEVWTEAEVRLRQRGPRRAVDSVASVVRLKGMKAKHWVEEEQIHHWKEGELVPLANDHWSKTKRKAEVVDVLPFRVTPV